MNIKRIKVHLALKDYEFMEFEVLGVETLEQAQELAKTLKNAVTGTPTAFGGIVECHYTNCDHPFEAWKRINGLTVKGSWSGKKCMKCKSVMFSGDENWRPPKTDELNMGGEK